MEAAAVAGCVTPLRHARNGCSLRAGRPRSGLKISALRTAARLMSAVVAVATLGVLSGCGGSNSAIMYVLFDASQSSSEVIREGYREGALLMGATFCNRYRGQ